MKTLSRVLLLASTLCSTTALAATFSIVPSTTKLTVQSDGTASVLYTVTNTTANSFGDSEIPIAYLYYQTSAQPGTLTLQNNTCTTPLAANGQQGDSCTFGVKISNLSQTNSFTLTPQVCAAIVEKCSAPSGNNIVNVVVDPVTTPPFAYFSVEYGPYNRQFPYASYAILPMSTGSTPTPQTPVTGITLGNLYDNFPEIVVSTDGKWVYVVEPPKNQNSSGNADILVYSANNGQLTLQNTIPLNTTLSYISNIVVQPMPDNSRVYVTVGRSSPAADSAAVYVINDPSTATTATLLPVAGLVYPTSMALSADGSTLYIADQSGDNGQGSIVVLNTADNTVVQTLTGYFNQSGLYQIALSPDNTALYSTSTDNTNYISVIAISRDANGALTYQAKSPIIIAQPVGGNLPGLWAINVSKDSSTVFTADSFNSYVYATNVNTGNTSIIAVTGLGVGARPESLGFTPDGQTLFVGSNAIAPSVYPTTVEGWLNTQSLPSATNTVALPMIDGQTVSGMGQYNEFVN